MKREEATKVAFSIGAWIHTEGNSVLFATSQFYEFANAIEARYWDRTRGGPGSGQGRKQVADTPTKRYNVTLDDKTADTLRDHGDGNLSEGIRRASRKISDDRREKVIEKAMS